MATFTNQATLIFNGQSTSSNVTTGELITGLTLTKTAIVGEYGRGDNVSYIVTVTNAGGAVTGATLTDDLGAYTVGTTTVYPLSYVAGSLLYYQNGAPATGATAAGGPPLVITGIDIPAGGNVQIIYEATANEYAPLATGSEIVNTAALTGTGVTEPTEDTATVPLTETQVEQALEKRIAALLREVEGVGSCRVMVTLESGTRTVYAADATSSVGADGATAYSESYLTVDTDAGPVGLLLTRIQPTVKGVAVVCDGGGDATVQQRVMQVVTTAFHISERRVCVVKQE